MTVAGYDFKEASSLTAVSKCERPMLFFHGTADDFIPYSMMNELYEAKPGTNKQMLTAKGATHANSLYLLGESYWYKVICCSMNKKHRPFTFRYSSK